MKYTLKTLLTTTVLTLPTTFGADDASAAQSAASAHGPAVIVTSSEKMDPETRKAVTEAEEAIEDFNEIAAARAEMEAQVNITSSEKMDPEARKAVTEAEEAIAALNKVAARKEMKAQIKKNRGSSAK